MTCLWNPEKFCLGNPEFLGFEIRNPTNPESTRLSTEILYLKSGIHGVASRIPDCLEIPYMGRGTTHDTQSQMDWENGPSFQQTNLTNTTRVKGIPI